MDSALAGSLKRGETRRDESALALSVRNDESICRTFDTKKLLHILRKISFACNCRMAHGALRRQSARHFYLNFQTAENIFCARSAHSQSYSGRVLYNCGSCFDVLKKSSVFHGLSYQSSNRMDKHHGGNFF